MKRTLRKLWMVLRDRNSVVIRDGFACASWAAQFIPAVTGTSFSTLSKCSGCGKISELDSAWQDMHEPTCAALVIAEFQRKLLGSKA
jgi:hypothetical protein